VWIRKKYKDSFQENLKTLIEDKLEGGRSCGGREAERAGSVWI